MQTAAFVAAAAAAAAAELGCTVDPLHTGYDMPGNDYRQVSVTVDPKMNSSAACGAECCLDTECAGFTFCVAPVSSGGCVGGQHCCFLKNKVGAYRKSALKDMASSSVSGRPTPVPPPMSKLLWTVGPTGFPNGGGISSPAVADGLVVTGSFNSSVFAVAAANGTLAWYVPVPGPVLGSPAFVDGVAYIGLSGAHSFLAISKGKTAWTFNTSGSTSGKPVVVSGVVYFGCNDGYVYALSAADGSLKWKFQTGGPVDGTPAVDGGVLYIGSYDTHLYALNAATGTLKWKVACGGGVGGPASVVGSVVLTASGNIATGGLLSAFDTATGAKKWTAAVVTGPYSPNFAVVGQTVFVAGNGYVEALDGNNGTAVWRSNIGGEQQAISADSSAVYVSTGTAQSVYALHASTGLVMWEYKTGQNTFSTPTASGGAVFVSTGADQQPGGALIAVDASP
eukprot:TRINITY_DN494_c0_g1_i2.p1 TRINITY_DN494_c0_g1~~TRINITY_DN494_c0_g1_i2.p1  ORF type:complete len:471 (+),score=142.81 TRINITY_DN494_c0_g1_i2:62-1414(+)